MFLRCSQNRNSPTQEWTCDLGTGDSQPDPNRACFPEKIKPRFLSHDPNDHGMNNTEPKTEGSDVHRVLREGSAQLRGRPRHLQIPSMPTHTDIFFGNVLSMVPREAFWKGFSRWQTLAERSAPTSERSAAWAELPGESLEASRNVWPFPGRERSGARRSPLRKLTRDNLSGPSLRRSCRVSRRRAPPTAQATRARAARGPIFGNLGVAQRNPGSIGIRDARFIFPSSVLL